MRRVRCLDHVEWLGPAVPWLGRIAPLACGLFLLAIAVRPALSESAPSIPAVEKPQFIYSMGQPPVHKPYIGGAFYRMDHDGAYLSGGSGFAGVYRELVSPMWNIFGYQAEAYAGGDEAGATGGLRALVGSRGIFLHAGVDYDIRDNRPDFILSFAPNIFRGGMFYTGGWFRLDWLPWRDHSFNLGWAMPVGVPHAGKTRSRKTTVALPKGSNPHPERTAPDPEIDRALARARRGALWIAAFNGAYVDPAGSSYEDALREFRTIVLAFKDSLASTDELHPRGHTFPLELELYHGQLAQAFALAAPSDRGQRVEKRAREFLLDEVLLPYDRAIGRFKKHDSLNGFGKIAQVKFATWLETDSGLAVQEQQTCVYVFSRVVEILEESRAAIRKGVRGDARKVWLPLQYAVRQDECDTQAELDSLVERAVGDQFTNSNRLLLVDAQGFARALRGSVHDAQDYHVLWVHDYRGKNAAGDPDRIGFAQTLEYLRAMTDRVRDYDHTGKLPAYIIMLDQNYYEVNDGRRWMSLLEDPLHARVRLPHGFESMSAELDSVQNALRSAVEGSTRLRELRQRWGDDAIRKLVKVHVNITNPSDLSFRTHRLIRFVPFMPDGAMIDHRKIAFWDASEADPGRGMAMYTGTGVGEHYSTRTWEDRAVATQGPTLLSLRDAARRVLIANGFKPEQIPPQLEASPLPMDYGQRLVELEAQGWDARTLQVHNDTGFAAKEASLAQAILYTMMPPGSVIYVPDSIWISPIWAGQLSGAALRGCHVYVIAPAREHAPAAGPPIMERTRETFSRFIEIQRLLRPEMDRVGGVFRVGMYTRESDVGDVVARGQKMLAGLERAPFLKEEFGFPDSVYTRLTAELEHLKAAGYRGTQLLENDLDRKPIIHRKTQFFATREALQGMAMLPGAAQYIAHNFAILARARSQVDTTNAEDVLEALRPMYEAARKTLPADLRSRSIYYLTAGSLNHDPRGFMLDGEVLLIVSSAWALQGYLDFIGLVGETTWIAEQYQLDALQPDLGGWQRKLGRTLEDLL